MRKAKMTAEEIIERLEISLNWYGDAMERAIADNDKQAYLVASDKYFDMRYILDNISDVIDKK